MGAKEENAQIAPLPPLPISPLSLVINMPLLIPSPLTLLSFVGEMGEPEGLVGWWFVG